MMDLKLIDEMHQENISHEKDETRNDLAMFVDSVTLLHKKCQLHSPSKFDAEEILAMNYRDMTTLVAIDVCRNLSLLVRWANENEGQKASTNRPRDKGGEKSRKSSVKTIVALSRLVMGFLATDRALNLPADEVDHMVLDCLLNAYRLPSLVNNFRAETMNFYEWWRCRIKCWIKQPASENSQSSDFYQELGWRHLAVMIRETYDQLRPPPTSIMVTGARSKEVNGNYKLVGGSSSKTANSVMQRNEKHHPIYYSRKVTYENTTSDGRTFSLCLSLVDHSPTSTTHNSSGYSLWFLTELDEEQPNTDCDIDYYCALPRNGKHTRPNPIPPLDGWKRCSHGLFPPPKLVPSRSTDLRINDGNSSETYWQGLARWILEEDLISTCLCWCKHKPRNEAVDSGIALVLEFMSEIYQEEGSKNPDAAASSSLGTEFILKFAASCLQRGE